MTICLPDGWRIACFFRKDNLMKVTITLNRGCNLNCSWCYASKTGFKKELDMGEDVFKKILSFCEEAKAKSVCLIGGEPTIYPKIHDVIRALKEKSMYFSIVSNGLIFKSVEEVKRFKDSGLEHITISVKSYDKETYNAVTGKDSFDDVIAALRNLVENGIDVAASYVLSEESIVGIKEMVEKVSSTGCAKFFFSFYRGTDENDNISSVSDRVSFIRRVEDLHSWMINNIPNLKMVFLDPLCLFDDYFIDGNIENLGWPCYVHGSSDVVFDSLGNVIPCNTLYDVTICKIGKDFNSYEEYLSLDKPDYKKLRGLPSLKCKECQYFERCKGKCVCNWINHSFPTLEEYKSLDNYFVDETSKTMRNARLNKIISEIMCFDPKNYVAKNEDCKLILGIEPYKNAYTNQLSGIVGNNVYANYFNGNTAFFPGSTGKYTSSFVNVMSLLIGSYDSSLYIINYLHKAGKLQNLCHYLMSKGIYLANASDLAVATASNISKLVDSCSEVLVCGLNRSDSNGKAIISKLKTSTKTRSIKIMHPSSNNTNKPGFFEAWYFHDDNSKALREINKGMKAKLCDFILK